MQDVQTHLAAVENPRRDGGTGGETAGGGAAKKLTTALLCLILSSAAFSAECDQTSIGCTPLTDFAPGETYHGLPGGLYPDGANEPPAEHAAIGADLAHSLDGQPVVLMSIGMSNASQAWWAGAWDKPNPNAWSFAGQCRDSALVSPDVTIVNGAKHAQTAEDWQSGSENYSRIRDFVLAPRGLTPDDVTVLWVKLCNKVNDGPLPPLLPDENADAWQLRDAAEGVRTALEAEYPNAQLIFVSTRSYAGYAGIDPLPDVASPEPYAYEGAFGLRAFIAAHLGESAPWIGWGPYWWGDGEEDGWTCDLYQPDGIHHAAPKDWDPEQPASEQGGEAKQAKMLFDFFLSDECAWPWFAATPADVNNDGLVGTADLVQLLSAWGITRADQPAWSWAQRADLDGDGVVGFGDQLIMMAAWG
jgi:hypothetical protein